MEAGRRGLLALAAAALAVYPAALGWWSEGILSAFRHFANDTFYYLAIAKHDLPFPLYSFDGLHPTNGFHPLWQVFLNAAFQNVAALSSDQAAQIAFAHGIGAVCVAAAAALLALAAGRLIGSAGIALFAVVPGFLFLATALVMPGYGALWSFANGLESPFSLLIFAALLLYLIEIDFYARPTPGRATAVGALVAAMVMARLDDVFMPVALSLPVLFSGRAWRERLRTLTWLNLIPALTLAAYLAVNHVFVGAATPVSGVLKGGGAPFWTLRETAALFLPLEAVLTGAWRAPDPRAAFLLAPAAAAAGFLVWLRRGAPPEPILRRRGLLAALAAYVLLKAGYNAVFVQLWHQGHWYFPVSFVIASLLIGVMLEAASGAPRAGRARFGWSLAAGVAATLYAGNAVISAAESADRGRRMHDFWAARERINAEVAAIDPEMRILSIDDGIVAYALDAPVMSGFGFALDPEAARAVLQGRRYRVAWDRGFRYLASLHNFPAFHAPPGTDVTAEMTATGWIPARDAEWLRASIAYVDPSTGFKLLRLEARGEEGDGS